MKTSELTGAALDWAAAKCEGFTPGLVFGRGAVRVDGFWEKPCATGGTQGYVLSHDWKRLHQQCEGPPFNSFTKMWSPSTNWAQGGPIIEREKLGFWMSANDDHKGEWACATDDWMALDIDTDEFLNSPMPYHGVTPLVAAMRCYVASKLGDEVDVPAELN